MKRKTLATIVLALTLLLSTVAITTAAPCRQGETPFLVTYQGYLTDADGNPVDGSADFRFGIYDAEAGGTALWEETHEDVSLNGGYFTIILGTTTPLTTDIFTGGERWLQVSVDTGGGYTDMPRQRVTAAPYALYASYAEEVDWNKDFRLERCCEKT